MVFAGSPSKSMIFQPVVCAASGRDESRRARAECVQRFATELIEAALQSGNVRRQRGGDAGRLRQPVLHDHCGTPRRAPFGGREDRSERMVDFCKCPTQRCRLAPRILQPILICGRLVLGPRRSRAISQPSTAPATASQSPSRDRRPAAARPTPSCPRSSRRTDLLRRKCRRVESSAWFRYRDCDRVPVDAEELQNGGIAEQD